ncbi:hypothetical protein AGLY_014330 [Aphis glycines]|uniref:Uncharacterized protein n=1 Tax=Aphis glycines TaxID=307491 RepID=A0A6G0T422_APHGL|nr:hypothetical protein AGLY_014330 [Aphis glycines]
MPSAYTLQQKLRINKRNVTKHRRAFRNNCRPRSTRQRRPVPSSTVIRPPTTPTSAELNRKPTTDTADQDQAQQRSDHRLGPSSTAIQSPTLLITPTSDRLSLYTDYGSTVVTCFPFHAPLVVLCTDYGSTVVVYLHSIIQTNHSPPSDHTFGHRESDIHYSISIKSRVKVISLQLAPNDTGSIWKKILLRLRDFLK